MNRELERRSCGSEQQTRARLRTQARPRSSPRPDARCDPRARPRARVPDHRQQPQTGAHRALRALPEVLGHREQHANIAKIASQRGSRPTCNERERNSARSSSVATGRLRSRPPRRRATSTETPPTISASAPALLQPCWPPGSVRRSTHQPTIDSPPHGIQPRTLVGADAGTRVTVAISATTATGTLIRNTQPHSVRQKPAAEDRTERQGYESRCRMIPTARGAPPR